MNGLKKYLTGSYLPTLEIEVQPSIFGMQKETKFSFTDTI
jgi:hypothetical protein|tara:strand:+ start:491 stop:610 length:120 start_codon:yes stop_codon:yes gene_type:complete